MRDDLIETLRDCANALGELLPREHAYRRILEQANRLLDRHDLDGEGFVLVPKEPTNAMVEAAELDSGGLLSVDDIVDAYRAMVAAAPSPDRRT